MPSGLGTGEPSRMRAIFRCLAYMAKRSIMATYMAGPHRRLGPPDRLGRPQESNAGATMNLRFDGKIVAVSGAGHGLGRAIAQTFSNLGARVFGCAPRLEKVCA